MSYIIADIGRRIDNLLGRRELMAMGNPAGKTKGAALHRAK